MKITKIEHHKDHESLLNSRNINRYIYFQIVKKFIKKQTRILPFRTKDIRVSVL